MRIPKSVLKIAAIASDDEVKSALCHVQFQRRGEKDRLIAMASDGRRALRVDFDEDESELLPGLEQSDTVVEGYTVNIPAEVVVQACKSAPSKTVIVNEAATSGTVRIVGASDGGGLVNLIEANIDGKVDFPDVEAVIPSYAIIKGDDTNRAVHVRVSIDLLIGLLKTMRDIVVDGEGWVCLDVPLKSGRAIRITQADESINAVAALMPLNEQDAEQK